MIVAMKRLLIATIVLPLSIECAFMMGQPCIDSTTFTFGTYEYEGGITTRNCPWLESSTAEANERRRVKWCGGVVYEGLIVDEQCPKSCLVCQEESVSNAPSTGDGDDDDEENIGVQNNITYIPSASPIFELSAFPTLLSSSKPSSFPTLLSSSKPSSFPTRLSSPKPSSYPTIFTSQKPSTQPSQSPTKTMRPTITTSTIPSSHPTPTVSMHPTSSPSIKPTSMPSPTPSYSPSYQLQSFQIYVSMDFDNLQEFDGKAKRTFEETTDRFIKTILDDYYGDDFKVIVSIQGFQSVEPGSNQRALKGKTRSSTSTKHDEELRHSKSSERNMQQMNTSLRIFIEAYVDVRSSTTYTTNVLIDEIKAALDEDSERYDFILSLQLTDTTSTFYQIDFMKKFTINNEEILIITNDDPNALQYLSYGAGIGVGALAVLVGVFLIMRKRRETRISQYHIDSQLYNSQIMDPRISSMIEVADDNGEMSTLGDPGGQTIFSSKDPFQLNGDAEQSHEPSLLGNYDYQRIYGGDTPSLSTATRSLGNQEEERVVVIAPHGSLGVVIGTPSGFPAIHAIKETSVIIDEVQIGDKLVSVDGEDTTKMTAIRVSNLIGSKALNPKRVLVFSRPVPYQ